ncbi:hypothetical protein [Aquimarina hainanensis]|uniref:hypothetical protein n=1 Tax=Aquimarina hainanensis TaxID=1578017 RepID=UPI0036226209
MGKHKGHILFSSLGYILKAIWKLLLLGLYATAKILETLAGFCSKLLDKFLK